MKSYREFFISRITSNFNLTNRVCLNFTTVWNNNIIIWSSSLNLEYYNIPFVNIFI